MVELEIMREPRALAFEDWNDLYSCYTGTCEGISHYRDNPHLLKALVNDTIRGIRLHEPRIGLACIVEDLTELYETGRSSCGCASHQMFQQKLEDEANSDKEDMVHDDIQNGEWQHHLETHFFLDGLAKVGCVLCQPTKL